MTTPRVAVAVAELAVVSQHHHNCAVCDTQPSPVAIGTIGLFEGGDRRACDIYRPEYDCMMRNNGQSFCLICQDAIIGVIRQEAWFGECFVSSAIHGNPHHSDVQTFRQWRDRQLQGPAGGRVAMRALMEVYGVLGPIAARWVKRHPLVAIWCRRRVLGSLARRLRR